MNRRIVCCTNTYPPRSIGGAEIVVHEHAKAMNRTDNQVVIFSGDLNPSGIRHSLRKDTYEGVTVHRMVLHHRDYDWKRAGFVNSTIDDEFVRIVDLFRPEIVHFHNMQGLSLGAIRLVQRRGIRTVLTLHDHWGFCYKNTLLKRDHEVCRDYKRCAECMRFVVTDKGQRIPIRFRNDYFRFQLDAVDRFILPSAYLAGAYSRAGFSQARMRVIGNGVDLRRYGAVKKSHRYGSIRFTFIGRLAPHKGVYNLLLGFKKASDHAGVTLNIVGDGELTGELPRMMRELALTDRIKLYGHVANHEIPGVLAETDVLILCSVWPENQPISILEAFASGTPVIGSRIGGIPELVRDGENGFLVTPSDPEALADSMERFVRNPALITTMGRAALASVDTMKVETSVRSILAVYDEPILPAPPENSARRKILCVGRGVEPQCCDALENVSLLPAAIGWQFLWDQWVEPRDAHDVDLIWLVDRDTSYHSSHPVSRENVPRLVPHVNRLLRRRNERMPGDIVYDTAADIEFALAACLQ